MIMPPFARTVILLSLVGLASRGVSADCEPCSNKPSGPMAARNRTCEGWRLTEKKCASNRMAWGSNLVCELECFKYGHPYYENKKCCTGDEPELDAVAPVDELTTDEDTLPETASPTTSVPTSTPTTTGAPTDVPTTAGPSSSFAPTTAEPSSRPSGSPTTAEPTSYPSLSPTEPPTTLSPSSNPSSAPSSSPSSTPSLAPSESPSSAPSSAPSLAPSKSPSSSPSSTPSLAQSKSPSSAPTSTPSTTPTLAPTCKVCADISKYDGYTCTDIASWGGKELKCNKDKKWIEKGYCAYTCYVAGKGYDGDVCCEA